MSALKLAIFYYSSTGGNHKVSSWAAEAAEKAGAEVRRRIFKETAPEAAIKENPAWKKFREGEAKNIHEAELDDLEWAEAIFFCIPTRYGNLPSQVQAFLDTTGGLWSKGKLTDKVISATSSAMNVHGGQETTVEAIYKTACHWGCIIVPPGYTDKVTFTAGGNPYGTSASIDSEGNIQNDEKVKTAVEHQIKRLIEIAEKIHS